MNSDMISLKPSNTFKHQLNMVMNGYEFTVLCSIKQTTLYFKFIVFLILKKVIIVFELEKLKGTVDFLYRKFLENIFLTSFSFKR
jgi:hypothetical protein